MSFPFATRSNFSLSKTNATFFSKFNHEVEKYFQPQKSENRKKNFSSLRLLFVIFFEFTNYKFAFAQDFPVRKSIVISIFAIVS